MAFENFIGRSASEEELSSIFVKEIQADFVKHQSTCYFIKLEKTDLLKTSRVAWVKIFESHEALHDFYFNTKHRRASILIKYLDDNRYAILCQGFYISNSFQFSSTEVFGSHPKETITNVETHLMISRELLENGFKDLAQLFESTRRNKAM